MTYIADRYNFEPVTFDADQHRSLAESIEDLMRISETDPVDGFALVSALMDLVAVIASAADKGTSLKASA